MINLIYPNYRLDCSIFNHKENTFVKSNPHDPWTFEWFLGKTDLEYTVDCEIDKNKVNYILFNIMLPKTWVDLENIPTRVWNYIRHDKNSRLLLYNATEANGPERSPPVWKKLKKFLQSKSIPAEKVYYISGNLEVTQCLEKIEYWQDINSLGIDIFEMIYHEKLLKYDGLDFLKSLQLYESTKQKKDFLCLNNSLRQHRQAFLYYLHKHDLIQDNILSCNWSRGKHIMPEKIFNTEYNIDDDYSNFYSTINSMHLQLENDNQQSSSYKWYGDTKFSIVTETHDRSNLLFITEKTYKPLALGHPFLVLGSTGTLRYLKELGYKTFEKYFDESYDQTSCVKEKIKIILKNVQKSINIDKDLINILYHNRDNFFKQHAKKRSRDAVKYFL